MKSILLALTLSLISLTSFADVKIIGTIKTDKGEKTISLDTATKILKVGEDVYDFDGAIMGSVLAHRTLVAGETQESLSIMPTGFSDYAQMFPKAGKCEANQSEMMLMTQYAKEVAVSTEPSFYCIKKASN